jgi:hypothetical protein
VQEALTDHRWKEAMNEEMRSLQKNSTWEVVHTQFWVFLSWFCGAELT